MEGWVQSVFPLKPYEMRWRDISRTSTKASGPCLGLAVQPHIVPKPKNSTPLEIATSESLFLLPSPRWSVQLCRLVTWEGLCRTLLDRPWAQRKRDLHRKVLSIQVRLVPTVFHAPRPVAKHRYPKLRVMPESPKSVISANPDHQNINTPKGHTDRQFSFAESLFTARY